MYAKSLSSLVLTQSAIPPARQLCGSGLALVFQQCYGGARSAGGRLPRRGGPRRWRFMKAFNAVRLFPLLPTGLVLLASIALAGPIGVSGSGTFTSDLMVRADSSFLVLFSGSNGIDSVSVNGGCNHWLNTRAFCETETIGSADIDGVSFGFGNGSYYSFSLGGPNDSVSGADPIHDHFASVSIIGSIQITSQVCVPNVYCTGSFIVVPTPSVPEPGTGGFVFLGAGLIAFYRWRRSRALG